MKSPSFVAAFMPYSIRNRLTALKKDRGEYIKPADVNSLYQAMIKQGMPALLLVYYLALVRWADGANL